MGIELELKFKADKMTLQALAAAFPQPGVLLSMETVYYDTPNGDLSARRYTLRKRLENGVSVCTVKTPAGKQGRNEWETESATIEEAIPMLCKLGAPEELSTLVQPGLQAICGAKFTRMAKTVEFDGAVIELALDEGVLTGGGKQLTFCEAELELKHGSQQALFALGQALSQRFSLEKEPKSKFRRALDLTKGD